MDGPPDVVGLTVALQSMTDLVSRGFGIISPGMGDFYSVIAGLSFAAMVMLWIFQGTPSIHVPLILFMFKLSVFTFILGKWWTITNMLSTDAIDLGLRAGTSVIEVKDFRDVGYIAHQGSVASEPIFKHIGMLSGPVATFENLDQILVYMLAAFTLQIGFIILALQVFFILLEWTVMSVAAFCLMPFAILNHTSYMAERAIGYLSASMIRLLVLALLVSLTRNVLSGFQYSENIPLKQAVGAFALSLACFVSAIWVPHKAMGMINGGPVLSAGGALATLWAASKLGGSAVSSVAKGANAVAEGAKATYQRMSGMSDGGGSAKGAGGGPSSPGGPSSGGGGGPGAQFRDALGGGQGTSKWHGAPTKPQQKAAAAVGVNLDGMNKAQASKALHDAGVKGGGAGEYGKMLAAGAVGGSSSNTPNPGGLGKDIAGMKANDATEAIQARAKASDPGSGEAPTEQQYNDAKTLGVDITGMSGDQADRAIDAQMTWFDHYKATGGKNGAPGESSGDVGASSQPIPVKTSKASAAGAGSSPSSSPASNPADAQTAAAQQAHGLGPHAPSTPSSISMAGAVNRKPVSNAPDSAAAMKFEQQRAAQGGGVQANHPELIDTASDAIETHADTMKSQGAPDQEVHEMRSAQYRTLATSMAAGYDSEPDAKGYFENQFTKIDAIQDPERRANAFQGFTSTMAAAADQKRTSSSQAAE